MRWSRRGTVSRVADAGFLLHGVLFAAIVAAYAYCRQAGRDFWRLADLFAPGLLLVYAFGRLGTVFGPAASGAAALSGGLFSEKGAVVFESLWNLVLAAIIFRRRQESVTGALFLRGLIWHGAGLYTAEWLRPEALLWGHLRVRQLMGFVVTHVALILLWWRRKQGRPPA